MRAELATEAIVLGGLDYGDSDRVLTLLSADRGRLPAFAAGARRSKRRFAGALEPFTVLSVRLRQGRGELLFLESCTILEAHAGLRDDLGRIAHAGHAAELCRELARDHEPHPKMFQALRDYLGKLAVGPARPEDLLALELRLLESAGLAPRISSCAICGGGVAGRALFDPGHGGFLCEGCEPGAFPGSLRVEAAARAAVQALQEQGPFGGLTIADSRTRAAARVVVRRCTAEALGKNPRSLAVLEELGIEG